MKLALSIWQKDGLNKITNTQEPKALAETEESRAEQQTQMQEL